MPIALDVMPVVAPADEILGPAQGQWTYAAYLELPQDQQRYEIVDGVIYMTPSAGEAHQFSSSRFVGYLLTHVDFAGLGRVYHAPFDVILAPDVVVQPDVLVVLHEQAHIITPRGIMGAPNLVVEIASPSTATHDRGRKMEAYSRAGVSEYWLADPFAHTVELLVLESGMYRSRGVFQGQAILPSTVIPNLPIRVEQFFS